jgi:AraC family transcriptional regulator, arabinose operon regulatory protein
MKAPVVDARVTWAVAEMQARMAEPFKMAELAGRVNLSTSRFRHLFAAQTGLPPSQYLRRMRLRRARLLLERSFLSVKEVMALVGYNDPSHFSRDFKQFHGVLPSIVGGPGAPGLAISPRHRRFRQSRNRDPGALCA